MDYRNLQREQLEEISRSDWLAEDFADHIQEDFLISAPPDLKSSVIRRCAQPDVQLAAGARSLSRRTRLLLYSLKVGAAVAASVLLLALLPATFPPGGRSRGIRTVLSESPADHTRAEPHYLQLYRLGGLF